MFLVELYPAHTIGWFRAPAFTPNYIDTHGISSCLSRNILVYLELVVHILSDYHMKSTVILSSLQ